jgi:hypothetical protein
MLSHREIEAIQQMSSSENDKYTILRVKSDSNSFLRKNSAPATVGTSTWRTAVIPSKEVILLCDVGVTVAVEMVKLLSHKYTIRIALRKGKPAVLSGNCEFGVMGNI